jgi:neutral ceramidase
MSSQFLAGAAHGDITPPVGIAHGNWSAQVHDRAEGVDLPLFCTALAASDGLEEILIAEWDLLFPPEGAWLSEVRERITALTGVPGTHIRISASHTHSGPSLTPPWFSAGAEMIAPYRAALTDKVAGTCLAAHRAMRPARIGSGHGDCRVNANRRKPWKPKHPLMAPDPDGFSDHSVGVIRIDGDDGRPIAVLVNFAAHPTILAWDNRLISPDYPGTVRRTVESLMGATCLFLQGAAGNQDTVRDFSCRTEDARWVGRQIGIEAVRVAELIDTQPGRTEINRFVESSWTMGVAERVPEPPADTPVRCLSRVIQLPLWRREPPTPAELANLEELKQRLAGLREEGAPEEAIREVNRLTRRAALDLNIARQRSQGTHLGIELQGIRIGSTALVGIPVEPFAEIGAQVKAQSPFSTTFFSGYTNGVNAYLPISEAYDEGGYEVWMTPFARESAAMVVDEAAGLLNELWATSRGASR